MLLAGWIYLAGKSGSKIVSLSPRQLLLEPPTPESPDAMKIETP